MTDHDALLRAVLLDPADDGARLVYADWLEENGEPERAAFVRLQIDMRNDPPADDPVLRQDNMKGLRAYYAGRRARQRDLLFDHGFAWVEAGFPWARGERLSRSDDNDFHVWSELRPDVEVRYSFVRGFVGEIRLPTAVFLARAKALFAAHPVEAVRLTDAEPWQSLRPNYSWYDTAHAINLHPPSDLPDALWALLAGYDGDDSDLDDQCKVYQTKDAAWAALSRACVKYGRRLAGLE